MQTCAGPVEDPPAGIHWDEISLPHSLPCFQKLPGQMCNLGLAFRCPEPFLCPRRRQLPTPRLQFPFISRVLERRLQNSVTSAPRVTSRVTSRARHGCHSFSGPGACLLNASVQHYQQTEYLRPFPCRRHRLLNNSCSCVKASVQTAAGLCSLGIKPGLLCFQVVTGDDGGTMRIQSEEDLHRAERSGWICFHLKKLHHLKSREIK